MSAFQRKTIENIIRNKIGLWLKTFPEDKKNLVEEIENSYILTGGAIASMLQGEMPSDFDIYFDDVNVVEKVAEYYTSNLPETGITRCSIIKTDNRVEIKIKSAGLAGEEIDLNSYRYFEGSTDLEIQEYFNSIKNNKGKFKPQFITSNCISLSDDIQIITRFVGTPEYIHTNFDFVHAKNFFSEKTGLILFQDSLESIMTKRLKYIGSLYPVSSLFRLRKFFKREWNISAGEIFKIAYDISKLDMDDPIVLQEQLTGVDVAFFNEVISILKKELTTREIDRTYLFEVITKIFDQEDSISQVLGSEVIQVKN